MDRAFNFAKGVLKRPKGAFNYQKRAAKFIESVTQLANWAFKSNDDMIGSGLINQFRFLLIKFVTAAIFLKQTFLFPGSFHV